MELSAKMLFLLILRMIYRSSRFFPTEPNASYYLLHNPLTSYKKLEKSEAAILS